MSVRERGVADTRVVVRRVTNPADPTTDTNDAAVIPVDDGTQDKPTRDDAAVIRSIDPVDNANLVVVNERLTLVAAPSVAKPTELMVDEVVVCTRF